MDNKTGKIPVKLGWWATMM